ncbi:arylsulfatase [Membranihabitans marinus]|uniref:arylsulfatase n=1 Tax=Membranihabitans marinus TaxID=1227546 RepID=UPI001F466CDE|nr:arylsulfatase [Membranihabitans marinus]
MHFKFLLPLLLYTFFVLPIYSQQQPNVILILTDDQGYGDLGINGNPYIKTPHLDALAKESIRFNQFYVTPVCAPTRSSLITGRYSLRTGVRDTNNGGAQMASSEITIAEILRDAGYHTGAFGKWHLGDNYPMRPSDQGFQKSVIHQGGGMGQPGDHANYYRKDSSYFDPILWDNNKAKSYQGYCSDIFTTQAISFIEEHKNKPFFCYLAFNAPHTPLQVPDKYYQMYKDVDVSLGWPDSVQIRRPMTEKDKEDARKVYGMVTNIDDNVKRVLDKLKELNIEGETIVIFMTDNGPQQMRYVAGMKGLKTTVYNGGVRVPFFLRYPDGFSGNRDIDAPTAHIDVLPTLVELCGGQLPTDRIIDGRSLMPLINDAKYTWAERPLFFYWSRKYPELYQNMALQKGPYKLVAYADYDARLAEFELYNIENDPYEKDNIIHSNSSKAADLKEDMTNIYEELVVSDNLLDGPRIIIGSEHENPVTLNRNDVGGQRNIWRQEEAFGQWRVSTNAGRYKIKYTFLKPIKEGGSMILEANSFIHTKKHSKKDRNYIEWMDIDFPKMDTDLTPFYKSPDGRIILPFTVEIERLDS